ncbi:helix-turn-helix transcriptional regulator [Sulfitobacter aestuarii]|uniref:Helix-turn-helix transcriptional regulator n=1 Tax=Sulfitobacter aestuarii TaxID=2161676 RepID=A0ABW5TZQ0_9RHOB
MAQAAMRRSDRLFALLDSLGDHEIHRASDLAARHGVSLRTLYRDIDRLQRAGVPVSGTRGLGYRLAPALTLPPLTLQEDEVEALQLALAIVLQIPDPEMQAAAASLTDKIDAALPERTLPDDDAWQRIAHPFADPGRGLAHLPVLRAAIRARQKLRIVHTAQSGAVESHVLHPHRLEHQARTWLLSGYSETGETMLRLRLDLIETAEPLPELFV